MSAELLGVETILQAALRFRVTRKTERSVLINRVPTSARGFLLAVGEETH
jgi:hypothetical protein